VIEPVRVLAPNPGPMTLDGTNTWVLRASRSARSVVVDPGPLDDGHLAAVREAAGRVGLVVLTHRHHDHSEAAASFAASVGCGVRAADPRFQVRAVGDTAIRDGATGADLGLGDGEVLTLDGLAITVVATPGHTSDSRSLRLADGSLLTGDTVLGRGTSVVAHPDGQLGAYLGSLQRLRDLAEDGLVTRLLPGHGPTMDDALGTLDGYLAHRRERLEQVRQAIEAGARTPRDVVERVYADVDRAVWPAAELSVAAQLHHLAAGG